MPQPSGLAEEVLYAKGYNHTANCRPWIWVYQDRAGRRPFLPLGSLKGWTIIPLERVKQVEFEVSQEPDGSCAVKVRLAQPKGE